MGQRYSTQLGGSKNLAGLKDHFSSNRQPRCEQIYINCGLLLKDNLRTLRSRRGPTTKTNTADRHAYSRRLDRAVRIVAGMENKKMTHQRLRITCEQGQNQDSILLRRTHKGIAAQFHSTCVTAPGLFAILALHPIKAMSFELNSASFPRRVK